MKTDGPVKKLESHRSDEESASPQVLRVRRGRRTGRWRRIGWFGLLGAALVAALVHAGRLLVFYAHHIETDDAQIEGRVYPVLPKVPGYVTAVGVQDNQTVSAGQVVVQIEPRDFVVRVQRAEATLDYARASVDVARANVDASASRRVKTAADVRRYSILRDKAEISQQEFGAAKAAADAAAAELQAATRQVAAAEADVAQKSAELEAAKLDLSYTTLAAPSVGRVTKKAVEVGQYVQAGQPLLAVVQDRDLWVVANYKETQLRGIRQGQPATVFVDAYPDHEFHGQVDSIAAATGARFALLPPDNASGNFVKVVQRVPVKVLITDPFDPDHPLRVGMNVTVAIEIR